jgi:hypothetical protein
MRKKLDLRAYHEAKAFEIVRAIYAKEWYMSDNYKEFALVVEKEVTLSPVQWAYVLSEWEWLQKNIN